MSGMSTLAAPVDGVLVPLASVAMTLMTQVDKPPFTIARGGPKIQFSTGWHAVAVLQPVQAQSASAVQLGFGSLRLMHAFADVVGPLLQSNLPVPLLATRFMQSAPHEEPRSR